MEKIKEFLENLNSSGYSFLEYEGIFLEIKKDDNIEEILKQYEFKKKHSELFISDEYKNPGQIKKRDNILYNLVSTKTTEDVLTKIKSSKTYSMDMLFPARSFAETLREKGYKILPYKKDMNDEELKLFVIGQTILSLESFYCITDGITKFINQLKNTKE